MRHQEQTDSLEPDVHSFIVTLWTDEPARGVGAATWRGRITHVPDGERFYIRSLEEIPTFIASCLGEMEVGFRHYPRIWQWLRRQAARFRRRFWRGNCTSG